MATFNLHKIKNPVEETVTIQPDNMDAIVFKLAPFNTTIAFKVNAWDLSEDRAESTEMQFSIGANRIVGWDGITDEKGNPIAYTANNLGLLCNLPDFIPYIMEVGSQTIDEAHESKKKLQAEKKAKTETAETVEDSENNTETS